MKPLSITDSTAKRSITYKSAPIEVSMGDTWFRYARPEHFLLRRRFEVLRRLADDLIRRSGDLAEVGCGIGTLQQQIEEHYGVPVTGFDLNHGALLQNLSQQSSVCCYDIMDCAPEFRQKFSTIFLFDVLEHIADEQAFLEALNYHVAEGGHVVINVPAHQFFYSNYDRAVGHYRRYSVAELVRTVQRAGFTAARCTYWGVPLVPLLLIRKWVVDFVKSKEATISIGFEPKVPGGNRVLTLLSRCEWLPQRIFGTSVMGVFRGQR
jgi:2-polyprenyl-3-methyl-5-hydroxy-6-metoxy-1,4-benzoquinol methylase